MHNENLSDKIVIALAYFHRYGWIAVMVWLIMVIPEYGIYSMSICSIAFSIWSIVGYRLKWKHIYCSHQNASHQVMTPYRIRWEEMSVSDAYGIPLIFLFLGLMLLVV